MIIGSAARKRRMPEENLPYREIGEAEIEARAAVVTEFLSQRKRTAAYADLCASRLGISRSNFYRLAKAQDLSDVVGDRAARTGVWRLDDAVENKIALVLDRIGVEGRIEDAYALVARACLQTGLACPSREVIRKRMLEKRQRSALPLAGPKLQYDETGLGMGVVHAGHVSLPSLSLLLHGTSGRILAHRLEPQPNADTMLRLMDAVGLPSDTMLGRPRLKGGSAAALFGTRFGQFLLRPRSAGMSPSKHYTFRATIDEARTMVGALVDKHNALRPQIC